MRILFQLLLVLALSISGAVASYWWHPEAPRFVSSSLELDLTAVGELGEVAWVDARVNEDFEAGHWEGAVSLNEEYWEEGLMEFMISWNPDVPVVVYCSSRSCARSHEVARRLREELGVENVYALRGGWEALQTR